MPVGPDLRVYGEVRGLSEAAWARLADECPFETADYADGVLSLEHEGRWVDVESFMDALAGAVDAGGQGHLDSIDNDAWTITRYVLEAGKMTSQTFGINDVLENTVKDGNI
ncbi:hypothetical protein DVDV_3632 [Desulfovibrio sp. DV]|uniref:hypothetical protein n=1 Tax=Desulfovibrio sp. DV TaxID=1844708 RepID=UPI00094B9A9B|nr:hypothetical protein [Desulfovibrio sp. DV]OLN25087.1 hypothetical protein DVDV_3632 [Desulfovibrio sp. DV]